MPPPLPLGGGRHSPPPPARDDLSSLATEISIRRLNAAQFTAGTCGN